MKLNRKTVAFGTLAGAALIVATLAPIAPAQAYTGTFLSFPHQSAPQSFTGNDVVVQNRSYQGFAGKVALTVHDAHNVFLNNLDFADNGGDIFLVNCTGSIRIQYIRARNTGDGTIGSGHSNVIQFNNVWQSEPNVSNFGIHAVKSYGGHTEDAISIFKSGGVDDAHRLIIGDVHVESPLPPDALAWTSGSGTGIDLADYGGHDIELRNSTFLNPGQVGIQMHQPTRVHAHNNVVYGAARSGSNVGLSQWSATSCSSCTGNDYTSNRAWWVKANGTASPMWLSHTYPVADVNNVKQDTTINPANLHVVL